MLDSTNRSLFARSPPNCVVSMPEQNALPAPVRTAQPTSSSSAEAAERVGELEAQVDRQRVALLRPLQRDQRDALVQLERQQAGHRSGTVVT